MAKRTSYAKANSPIQRLTYQQIHSIFTQERERERKRDVHMQKAKSYSH